MKKTLKIVALAIAVLGAGAVTLTFMTSGPAERVKSLLLGAAEERIGRKIASGDFGGNPFSGFRVRDIRVSGTRAKEQPLLNMFSMRLGFSLWDLIRERKIHFKSLDFIRPAMRLVILEDGTNNLGDIMKRIVSAPEGVRAFPKIQLDEITVRDGTLRVQVFRAGQSPLDLTVRGVEFVLRPDSKGNFSRGAFRVRASLEKIMAKAEGELKLDRETVVVRWETSAFGATEAARIFTRREEFAEGLKLECAVAPRGTFTFRRGVVLATAAAKLDGVKVMGFSLGRGEFRGEYASNAVRFEGELSDGGASARWKSEIRMGKTRRLKADVALKGFSSSALLKAFAPELPEIVKGTVAARMHVTGDLPGEKLVGFDGTLDAGAASASAKGTVRLAKMVHLDTDVALKGFSSSALMKAFAPDLPEIVKGTVAARVNVSGEHPGVKLVRFDGTLAAGAASASAKGTVLMENSLHIDADAMLKGFSSSVLMKALAPDLPEIVKGTVSARVNVSGAHPGVKLVRFDGALSAGASSASAKGTVRLAKTPHIEADVALKGFSAKETLRKLSPAMSETISGTAGGNVHVSGNPAVTESLAVSGNARLAKGTIVYPTPSLKGTKNAKATLPVTELAARFQYKNLALTVGGMRAAGPGYSAAGSGSVRLWKNKKTGKIAGANWFDAQASVSAPEVARVLETNPHLGAFVSGALAASAKLRGNPNALDSLAGVADVRLARGRVTNPYVAGARNLPLNSNLSHFDFTDISGTFDVMKSVIRTNNFIMRGSVLNADARGTLGFNGQLNAHAGADVSGDVVGQINDFKAVLPKLKGLQDVERIKTSFELSGTIQNPKIHWNAQDALELGAKKLIKKKAGELLKDALGDPEGSGANQNIEDVLKDRLKKLKDMF